MGQGAYSISNDIAEIGLKLEIPITSSTSKDKVTATITSLPPKRLGFPSPSSMSGASGSPGATGPVAAAGVSAPSSPSGPVGTNGAEIPSQGQSGVILTPEGWQNENYILGHPLTVWIGDRFEFIKSTQKAMIIVKKLRSKDPLSRNLRAKGGEITIIFHSSSQSGN